MSVEKINFQGIRYNEAAGIPHIQAQIMRLVRGRDSSQSDGIAIRLWPVRAKLLALLIMWQPQCN